jgi:outer membrane immunogenic protein
MNKVSLGLVALLASAVLGSGALGSGAIAADVPPPVLSKAAPAAVTSWTGWYIGINGSGYSSVTNNIGISGTGALGAAVAAGTIPSPINLQYNGWLLGGTAGYNWQINPLWVFGLEADFAGGEAKSGTTAAPGPIITTATRELDDLGTVRGRLGMTVLPPMVTYVTGGLAFGDRKLGIGAVGPGVSAFNQASDYGVGWTVGFGIEYMFGPHWSFKGDFLYVDLGRISDTISAAGSSLTASVRDHEEVVRAGINYRF